VCGERGRWRLKSGVKSAQVNNMAQLGKEIAGFVSKRLLERDYAHAEQEIKGPAVSL
jgi:hypothetical protein